MYKCTPEGSHLQGLFRFDIVSALRRFNEHVASILVTVEFYKVGTIFYNTKVS
jgi:hypothetical protein